jgi:DNA adenine methylase
VIIIIAYTLKAKPPIKWAGGKGQLLSQLEPLFPPECIAYHEPFVGGGAVFFHLLPIRAYLIDYNEELINCYLVIRDDVEALIDDLRHHINEPSYYYQVRSNDTEEMDKVSRASRFLFLNKTAYNGLWRVNRQGRHNVPFGNYKNPKIADESNLRLVSVALKKAEIILGDFSAVLDFAKKRDFIYFDPPYNPISETASFTSYTSASFGIPDQQRLADVFKMLDERGCKVMLSNSDTELIRRSYKGYDIQVVQARRAINCRADRRGPINELVIRNYK